MDRLERLVNLVAALLSAARLLTAEEIGEQVPGYPAPRTPAFHRAFERDKETLRRMGIPLVTEDVDPGAVQSPQGYRVPRQLYELPDPGLAPDELAALALAAASVRLEGGEAQSAIWKLGGAPAPAAPSAPASLPGSDHLDPLFRAAAERRTVAFGYRGAQRKVDPWRLGFRAGHWYLAGWDHDRQGRRMFRLDRFEGRVKLETGSTFSHPPPPEASAVPPPPWEMGDDEPVTVELAVDADQAAFALRTAGAGAPRRQNDAGVVLALSVTNRAALRSFVLGMLDHAEVVGPPAEREAMVSWLEGIATGPAARRTGTRRPTGAPRRVPKARRR